MVTDPKPFFTFLLTLLLLFLSLPLSAAEEDGELLDRIVAVVNDDVVLEDEFNKELASIHKKLEEMGSPPSRSRRYASRPWKGSSCASCSCRKRRSWASTWTIRPCSRPSSPLPGATA